MIGLTTIVWSQILLFHLSSHSQRPFYMSARVQKPRPTFLDEQEPFHVIDDGTIYHTRGLNASCRREHFDFVAASYNILTLLYASFLFYFSSLAVVVFRLPWLNDFGWFSLSLFFLCKGKVMPGDSMRTRRQRRINNMQESNENSRSKKIEFKCSHTNQARSGYHTHGFRLKKRRVLTIRRFRRVSLVTTCIQTVVFFVTPIRFILPILRR